MVQQVNLSERELKDILKEMIELTCSEFGGRLTASDTHRWVESDGFYEVRFMLKFPEMKDFEEYESGIFIHNESGQQDLEYEWSEHNPQEIDFKTMSYMMDEFSTKYAIFEIIDYIDESLLKPSNRLNQLLDNYRYFGNNN